MSRTNGQFIAARQPFGNLVEPVSELQFEYSERILVVTRVKFRGVCGASGSWQALNDRAGSVMSANPYPDYGHDQGGDKLRDGGGVMHRTQPAEIVSCSLVLRR